MERRDEKENNFPELPSESEGGSLAIQKAATVPVEAEGSTKAGAAKLGSTAAKKPGSSPLAPGQKAAPGAKGELVIE